MKSYVNGDSMKKYLTRVLALLLTAALLLPAAGCHSTSPENTLKNNYTSFQEYTHDVFVNEISSNTLNLHYTLADPAAYGITDPKITLGDFSKESMQAAVMSMENYQAVLHSFSYEDLSPEDQLTYDILDSYFTTELSCPDLYLYGEPLSPTIGTQAQLPVLFAEYEFRSRQDVDNYLMLLSQLDEYYTSLMDFEKEKAKAGLFMPSYAAEDVISQCREYISGEDGNFLLTIFPEKLETVPDLDNDMKQSYIEQNAAIVEQDVIPAYQAIIGGLETLEKKSKNEYGLCHFKNGRKYYEYIVRSDTGSARTIPQIQEMLDEQMKADFQSMAAVIGQHPDILDQLDSYDGIQTDPNEILSDLQNKMTPFFPTPPSVSCTVKYVHPSLEKHLSPAFYLTPAIDDMSSNVIYINQGSKPDQLDLYTTLAHEGYPGHLYQTVYTNSTSPDCVRSLLNFPGYVEGWATYVEMISYGFADIDRALAKLLQSNQSVTLNLYAHLDIGIHYDGWTPDDAAAYLNDYGISNPDVVSEIYHAIVEAPGNYLKYYVGCLEFMDLRKQAQEYLGDQFKLKDFHEFLLKCGPAPFDIVEKYMILWLESVKKPS